MNFFIGVTDNNWYKFLAKLQPDEVNFWMPSANVSFRALQSGDLFLFKLHYPQNYIAGGGFFVKYSTMPLSMAWRAFEEKNGVASESQLREVINRHRRGSDLSDPIIGCCILTSPFFLNMNEWLPAPADWSRNIVRGKSYHTENLIGRQIWQQVKEKLEMIRVLEATKAANGEAPKYGKEQIIQPRLGQGAFRILVADAYQRRCAITGERTLPVLEASHIKPYRDSGPNEICNGLLLRADLHILFDKGYMTVTPGYHIEVSKIIKEEFENGRDYYAHHGHVLSVLPFSRKDHPDGQYLEWHNEKVYQG